MIKDVDYIIKRDFPREFSVAKFIDGGFSQEYIIVKHLTGLECSCISGIYRGYCKHKDWVGLLERNKPLPNNVTIAVEPNRQEMKKLVNSLLKR